MEHLDAKLEIRDIYAREIFDADGNMAVETEVLAGEGIVARASVSSRIPEAKRAKKTAEDINSFIAQELIGENVFAQEEIDRMLLSLDGSGDMSVLGTDALFSVSAAVAGAAAAALKIPLYRYLGGVRTKCMPVPVADVTGEGGCMLVPSEQMPFREQMDMCVKVSRRAGELLRERKISPPGERGGCASGAYSPEKILETVREAAEETGCRLGSDAMLAWNAVGLYRYDTQSRGYSVKEGADIWSAPRPVDEMCAYYSEMTERYFICSLEDPLSCEDWEGWVKLTQELGSRVQLIGNRLFRTQLERLEKGIRLGAANAVLVRPDWAGTLTGAADFIKTAQEAGYRVVLEPHEAGTADDLSADIAVAFHVGQFRAGEPFHMEHMEKYNRLLRIGEKLGEFS